MAEDLDDVRLTAMGLLIEVHDGLAARTATAFVQHGLSFVEFDVLIRLARSPRHRLRMSDLAAQTSLSTSGATRVVDRLVDRGWVCRDVSPRDRRQAFAVVTDAGAARLEAVLPEVVDAIEWWFTGRLAAAELETFLATLRALRVVVRPDADADSR